MKYLFYGSIGLVVIFIITSLLFDFGNSFEILLHLFEWTTRFVLPWIALYWFILFVKSRRE